MKKIKNIFYSFILIVFCFMTFGIFNQCDFSQVANAADDNNVFDAFGFVSVINDGIKITDRNVKNEDGVSVTSVLVNGAVTLDLKPLSKNYYFLLSDENEVYFSKNVAIKKAKIFEPDINDITNPDGSLADQEIINKVILQNTHFSYGGKTYYCGKSYIQKNTYDEKIEYYSFYSNADASYIPLFNTLENPLISYEEIEEDDGTYLYVYIIESYTLKSNTPSEVDFKFRINNGTENFPKYEDLTLKLLKSPVNFGNSKEEFIKFETYKEYNNKTQEYQYYDVGNWLQSEQTFNKVKLTFLNDLYEYSENSPLKFIINFNGFPYNFELYSKIVDGKNCLFVQYKDDVGGNFAELATKYEDTTNIYGVPMRLTSLLKIW